MGCAFTLHALGRFATVSPGDGGARGPPTTAPTPDAHQGRPPRPGADGWCAPPTRGWCGVLPCAFGSALSFQIAFRHLGEFTDSLTNRSMLIEIQAVRGGVSGFRVAAGCQLSGCLRSGCCFCALESGSYPPCPAPLCLSCAQIGGLTPELRPCAVVFPVSVLRDGCEAVQQICAAPLGPRIVENRRQIWSVPTLMCRSDA